MKAQADRDWLSDQSQRQAQGLAPSKPQLCIRRDSHDC
jgi:hypothetical protein